MRVRRVTSLPDNCCDGRQRQFPKLATRQHMPSQRLTRSLQLPLHRSDSIFPLTYLALKLYMTRYKEYP